MRTITASRRLKHSVILPFFLFYPDDTENSTTSTTYVQLDARSVEINFDEIPKPADHRLEMRWLVEHRTSDATIPAYARLTHEPYTGASPPAGTLWEHATTANSFTLEDSVWFSPWMDVTNWTGIHEFNVSHRISGAATSYIHGTAIHFRYVR